MTTCLRPLPRLFAAAGIALCTALSSGGAMAAGPSLSLAISPQPAVQGGFMAVSLRVAELLDVFAYQYSLSFNPAVLQVVGITEGSFLAAGGETVFVAGTIDNTLGNISLGAGSLLGTVPGVDGSGALSTVVFNVTGAGFSSLDFSDVLFLNANLDTIALQVENGSVQALAVPEPSAYLLLGSGLLGLALARQRRTG